eukprot:TRINITY_DN0_c1503_g1_i1.p1 TRINITY_DN0_c1503_g1~~TRINITY_DN0_c1503_g1_i1.p1  ORF type:complete len:105 (+),score=24.02 TRINITY_DN0_c1503_g1_i1:46-360(+)
MQHMRSSHSALRDDTSNSKSFWAQFKRSYQAFRIRFASFLRKFKKLLWVTSTAFIFLAMPMIFSHFMEMEFELQKLMRAEEMAAGNLPLGPGPGGLSTSSMKGL